ncbi:lipopolysaccharide transport system ATP-binding protein [Treponema bryantii]|uniref:Lipopolysaccharide transport system ATP-binding protein n=1 Tax=Treponema bryantii TaxID=163 RepID=A0A1I3IX80_9SPIR|nr:ABC transporter ATP-binding protein [Treponema bryantii]SFI52465.1 lipopolysaccharide transport system ATP-binding protein [Treponema bryantii]
MNNDIAIKVENLSKYYRLGVINNGTLFRDIQSFIAKKRGKDDPHAKLGSKYDSTADGFWALKDLNFEIKKGDRVGIIGHNGAGKSTLLKLLSQITSPTEGNIKIKGRIASLLEVGTGFHPELTGRENIFMNGAILGMTHAEIDSKVNQIIEFSEIGEHIDTPVKRYSSGMYVRLAFAVAAHLDSEILIADEVLAVGDAAFQKKALGKMNELSSGQGRTVLFVSHNMSQVKNLCNKGIVLEHGRIIRQDDNIQKSIDYYLGKNDDNSDIITTSWKNNGQFFDENFTPISFEIKDLQNNIVTGPLNFESDYKLVLTIDIEKINNNLHFWYQLYRGSEQIYDYHINDNKNIKCGKNVFELTIPKYSIMPGEYTFSLGATLNNIRWILNANNLDITINTKIIQTKQNIFSIKKV